MPPFRVLPRRYRILLRIIDDFFVLPRAMQTVFFIIFYRSFFIAILPRWTWIWLEDFVVPFTLTVGLTLVTALVVPTVLLIFAIWYFGVSPDFTSMLPKGGSRVDISPDADINAIMTRGGLPTMASEVDEKGRSIAPLRNRWVAVMIFPDPEERYCLRNYRLINILLPAPVLVFSYVVSIYNIVNGKAYTLGLEPEESRPSYYPFLVTAKPWIENIQCIWMTLAVLAGAYGIVIDYLGLETPRLRYVNLSLRSKEIYLLSRKKGVLKTFDEKLGQLFDLETMTLKVL